MVSVLVYMDAYGKRQKISYDSTILIDTDLRLIYGERQYRYPVHASQQAELYSRHRRMFPVQSCTVF